MDGMAERKVWATRCRANFNIKITINLMLIFALVRQSLGCKPIADIESFTDDKLGSAELVDEVESSGQRVIKITGMKNTGKTVSILCRGANSLVLEESVRSLHDALCVIRCLVKKR